MTNLTKKSLVSASIILEVNKMPIITKIALAKRRKDRLHIYIDRGNGEEYAFTVSEDLFVKRQFSKGMQLSEEDILKIRQEDVLDKAFQKTLNYLSYRMRSEKEVLQYLREQDVGNEDAAPLMERLRELSFLNDSAFANAFVRTKMNSQKKGPRLIEQELFEKGVSRKNVDTAMSEYSLEEQLDNAILCVEKKQSSYKSDGYRKKQQKLLQFLIQRGFTNEIAKQALLESNVEENENMEWDAVRKQGEKALKKYKSYDGWEKEQRIKQYLFSRGFSIELIYSWLQEEEE